MSSISMTDRDSFNTPKTQFYKIDNEITSRRWLLFFGYTVFPLIISSISSFVVVQDSWYSNNRNIINLVFAKYAWGWTSLVFFCLVFLKFQRGELRSSFFIRWILATIYWAVLTQNVIGSSFRDRVFVATGGGCSSGEFSTYGECKKTGSGVWVGGHRISGHCLLLIHASLFLWEEFGRRLYFKNQPSKKTVASNFELYLVYATRLLLSLFFLLLLITSTYFHTVSEKVSGSILGALYWFVSYTYILPSLGLQSS